MVVYLFFYSAKCLMYLPVVFFVVAADFANECHQYKEATTDDSNHNFSRHVIQSAQLFQVRVAQKRQVLGRM
jgi:hypothetical protein